MSYETKRVLVTAKAVPVPSKKYHNSVCTAGITEEGEFIRLYPIPYTTFCSKDSKFKKYDWIEVKCKKSDEYLQRKESYKVDSDSIKIIDHLDTKNCWRERNKIVLPLLSRNIEDLKCKYDSDKTSLGLIKPKEVLDFYASDDKDENEDEDDKETKNAFQAVFDLQNNGKLKSTPWISSIPHKFRYRYLCENESTLHDTICEDWEVFEAYRNWKSRYQPEDHLLEMMKKKFYEEFTTKSDLYFFMGTHSRFPKWMIIGLYYPRKPID